MGVKGFKTFVDRNAKRCVTEVDDLKDYAGSWVAIDVAIYMYKAEFGVTMGMQSIFQYFLNHYRSLVEQGLQPVYVFDSTKALEEKKMEEDIRAEKRRRQREMDAHKKATVEKNLKLLMNGGSNDIDPNQRLQQIMHLSDKKQQLRDTVLNVTPMHYTRLKSLFQQLSIPYVVATGEAEKACSWMAQHKLVDLVMTDDYDAIACGAPLVVRHYKPPMRQDYDSDFPPQPSRFKTSILSLDCLLSQLDITYQQLVDICILAGCDFCCTLPKIGIGRGYNAVKQYGDIDNYLLSSQGRHFATNLELMDNFPYYSARHLFMDQSCQIERTFLFDVTAPHPTA